MHHHPGYGHAYAYGHTPPPAPAPLRNSGAAVGSLIIACVCLGTCLWATALLPLAGAILGAIGTHETRTGAHRRGRPMAITGLILNTLLTLGGVVVVAALIADAY